MLAPPSARTDVGLAELASDGRLRRFAEKGALPGAPLVNAGIYVLQKRFVEEHPAQPSSLERDLLPQAIARDACHGYPVAGPLVDIGTPERYRAAQALLAGH